MIITARPVQGLSNFAHHMNIVYPEQCLLVSVEPEFSASFSSLEHLVHLGSCQGLLDHCGLDTGQVQRKDRSAHQSEVSRSKN